MSDCRTRDCQQPGWSMYAGHCYTHRPDAPDPTARYPLPAHRQCSLEGPCLHGTCAVQRCKNPGARVFHGACWQHRDAKINEATTKRIKRNRELAKAEQERLRDERFQAFKNLLNGAAS